MDSFPMDPMEWCEDPQLAAQFATMATRLELGVGRRLCVQGARRQQFGVVLSGRARVVRDGVVVDQLGAGDHFGEFTLLRKLPAPVTIVADLPTTVAVVTGPEFRGTIGADPRACGRLEQAVDRRIRDWVSAPDVAGAKQRVIA